VKILLDELLPHKLRIALSPEHDASTVAYLGWAGLKDGRVLRAAEDANFDMLLTADQSMESQQNIRGFRLGVVVLPTQFWPILRNHLPEIRNAVVIATPGRFQRVRFTRQD